MIQASDSPTPGLIKKWLNRDDGHDKDRNIQDVLEDIADALQGIESVANFFETLVIIAIILGVVLAIISFTH